MLSVASRALLDACAGLGLDTDALLREAELERARVLAPDERLPARAADALWEAAFARSTDAALALHAAEALPFGAYRTVDFLCAHSVDVASAYRRLADYFRLVDERAELVVEDRVVLMRTRAGTPVPPPAQEYTFAALIGRMAVCVAPPWSPARVELTFAAPDDPSEHERVFGAPVVFAASAPRIVFGADAWSARIGSANPALLAVLDDHARRLLAELPAASAEHDLAAAVRTRVAEALRDAEPERASAASVARALGLSERTLQRRLEERGQKFGELRDEARFALARAHLEDSAISLAETAWLLGFSDQSAFTRAFRRWSGLTPGAFRRRLRSG